MRSTENGPHEETRAERQARAKQFGAYLTKAAHAAGFDVRPRQGGRIRLAELTGLNITTVGRTLDGQTLPLPSQLSRWAHALGIDQREMLVESGLLPAETAPAPPIREVPSATLTPDEAMDAWGITDPNIRQMLRVNIVQAMQLQGGTEASDGRGA